MIGVFDSGVGGLTVLKYFLETLPAYNYVYLGDNARVPYGDKSQETIYQYTKQAIDFLFAHGCSIIIIACNSASARALRKIQQEYLPVKYPGKRVLGVVRPLAEKVARDKFTKVGVIGTRATIDSGVYKIEINNLNKKIEVRQQATPLLVPLIENKREDDMETKGILNQYLQPFKHNGTQALVLACTHYQFLLKQIKEIVGADVFVYNPGELVADSLRDYLNRHQEFASEDGQSGVQFFTTGQADVFKTIGEKFLGQRIDNIKSINI